MNETDLELAARLFLLGYDAAAAGISRELALIELLHLNYMLTEEVAT